MDLTCHHHHRCYISLTITLKHNLAFTLTSDPGPNSFSIPFFPVHLNDHLTLATGMDTYQHHCLQPCLTVTLNPSHAITLTSEPDQKCNSNLINPKHLTKHVTLTLALAPLPEPSPSPMTNCKPEPQFHTYPHIRATPEL